MSRLLLAIRSRLGVTASDEGMSTAEYAIGIVAACAFAAVLYRLLTGNWVEGLIHALIGHALSLIGL